MKPLEKLQTENVQLLREAIVAQTQQNYKKAKTYYYQASKVQINIARELEKTQSVEAPAYWISAANCALDSDDITTTCEILDVLKNQKSQLQEEELKRVKEIENWLELRLAPDKFIILPRVMQVKLLVFLVEQDKAHKMILERIKEYFNDLPKNIRNDLLQTLVKREEVSKILIWIIVQNYTKLPEE
ncbi:MAG: hypothetical protein ACFFBD_18430, partial [Candidatus Hodarchaeota archaeon]